MNTQKTIILVLCALLLLPLACTHGESGLPANPSPAPTETDAPAETANGETSAAPAVSEPPAGKQYVYDLRLTTLNELAIHNDIVETDDSIFLICGGYLYFSDKEYKDFMPLCSKPNCFHNDDECDARLDTKNGIWLYGSYIWYVSSERGIFDDANRDPLWLCRMRVDGTKHERVLKFYEEDHDFIVKMNSWTFYSSNKYLYANHTVCDHAYVFAEDAKTETELYIIDLETLEVKNAKQHELNVSAIAWGDGDLVYCIGVKDVGDPDYDGEQTLATGSQKTLLVYDFRNDELEFIGFLEGRGRFDPWNGSCGVVGNDFLYLRWDIDADTNNLWAIDVGTGECRLIVSKPRTEFLALIYDWTNGIFFGSSKVSGCEGFFAYDLVGEEIAHIPYEGMPEDFLDGQVNFHTDSYIFNCPKYVPSGEEGEESGFDTFYTVPTWYLDKREFGTESFGWRRWEP
ncbi:MAG: hypothetical protein II191_05440 [Clostridia bacterium]|nr:hypothetical protein [Clostridia bacterium]